MPPWLLPLQGQRQWLVSVFPDGSEDEWNTLLCTVSGQGLISDTKALLNRRILLQEMVSRISSDPGAPEKEELEAATREMRAIERQIKKFPERARAVINTLQN